tara:strand:- start:1234 stop:1701 length:468 start_codon:yes stop_codon:yes gene_type:complete
MKAIKDSNGEIKVFNSTPKNWGAVICGFDTFSKEKLESYGFYDVEKPAIKDSQEYGEIKWDSKNKVFKYPVKNKTFSLSVSELKAQKIANLKSIYKSKLATTDWYLIRSQEGVATPKSILDARAALRTECATKESEINSLTTKAAIVDYKLPSFR